MSFLAKQNLFLPRSVGERIKGLPLVPCLWDLRNLVKEGSVQRALWKDYLQTWRQTGFIRDEHFQAFPGKTVLIASLSNFIYQLKIEAAFGVALRMRGWRPIVLTTSRLNTWAHRYFKAFGLNEFVYLEDIRLSSGEKRECLEASRFFFTKEKPTFQDVKKWVYKDSWIGPQILSSVARSIHKGAPDPHDPATLELIRALLPSTLERVHRARKLLDLVNPSLMYLVEANYIVMGPLVDVAVASGINVAQVAQPSRDDAMICKRLTTETRRQHPSAVSMQSMNKFSESVWSDAQEAELQAEFGDRYGGKWFLQSRNQPGTKLKSRDEVYAQLGLDPTKKTAVVFSHILWDANLFYGDDLFEDYEDWFVQTVKAACANPSVNWVIKLHPANIWKRARDGVKDELAEVVLIDKHIGVLPGHVKLLLPSTDINTLSLFKSIDFAITVRGTAGMESPCFGVTTFTAGTGRYSGLGFTNDSSTKEQYLEKLASIEKTMPMTAEQTLLAKRHAYIAFKYRPWVMKSFKATFDYKTKGHHPLDHNLMPVVGSMAEIRANKDLECWAKWAENKDQIDYLSIE